MNITSSTSDLVRRHAFNRKWLALAFLAIAACSQAASDGEGTGSISTREQIAFILPQTIVKLPAKWAGSQVRLLAADALHDCTNVAQYDINGVFNVTVRREFKAANDKFLDALYADMATLEMDWQGSPNPPIPTNDLAKDWYRTREWQLGTSVAVSDVLQGSAPGTPGWKLPSSPTARDLALDTDFRTAGFNLCMAQQMRRHSPGSAANAGLFLPQAEQRELLEIVRERSQIAMLQYALFATIIASTHVSLQGVSSDQARLGEISTWLLNLPADVRERMGNDFATAVQLNAMAVEELTELLARSRTKREPFGRVPSDRADGYWGSESWYQREMAVLFGGDPLAVETTVDAGAPWSALLAAPGAGTNGDTWPESRTLPSFHTELFEPQVQELLRMARQNGTLKLRLVPRGAAVSCNQVDVQASIDGIYDDLETKVRNDACYLQTNNQCSTWSVPNGLPSDQYWLLTRHRISKTHAASLVKWLAEALTFPSCPVDATTDYEGALAVKSTEPFNSGGPIPTVVIANDVMELKPHSSLEARPLQAVGGLYSRIAPLYLADVRDVRTNIYDVALLGFNGRQGASWNYGPVAESKRIMGALSANAAVGRMLTGALNAAGGDPYLATTGARILALVRGAGGGLALSLHPENVDVGGTGPYEATGSYRPTLLLDPKTSDATCDNVTERCKLYALHDEPAGADIGAFPDTASTGTEPFRRWTPFSALAPPQPGTQCGAGRPWSSIPSRISPVRAGSSRTFSSGCAAPIFKPSTSESSLLGT